MNELFQLWFGMSVFEEEEKAQPPDDPRLWWIKAVKPTIFAAFAFVGCVAILAFTAIAVYRLAYAHFDFGHFDFSQALSLVLALFSIWLSATFYFRATDTSNKFYDRTFGHTKELIKALVRIESSFGEQLKHIQADTAEARRNSQSGNEQRKKPSESPTTEVTPTPQPHEPHSSNRSEETP